MLGRRAVVEVAADAHAGLAGAQLVAGDDRDPAVALQMAAKDHGVERVGADRPPCSRSRVGVVVDRVARQHPAAW